jgi:hypothetical protein
MSEVKGSDIRLNDVVKLTISKKNQVVPTTVQGQVSGIRFWLVDQLAITFDGITGEWFYLNEDVAVEVIDGSL